MAICAAVIFSVLSCTEDTPYPLEDTTYWDVLDDVGQSWRLSYADVSEDRVFITDSKHGIEIAEPGRDQFTVIPMPFTSEDSSYLLDYARFLHKEGKLIVSSQDHLLVMTDTGQIEFTFDCLDESSLGWVTDLNWENSKQTVSTLSLLSDGGLVLKDFNWRDAGDTAELVLSSTRRISQLDLLDRLRASSTLSFRASGGLSAGWLGREYTNDGESLLFFAVDDGEKIAIGLLNIECGSKPIIICDNLDTFGIWSMSNFELDEMQERRYDLSALQDSRQIRSYSQFLGIHHGKIILPYYQGDQACFGVYELSSDGQWNSSDAAYLIALDKESVVSAMKDVLK